MANPCLYQMKDGRILNYDEMRVELLNRAMKERAETTIPKEEVITDDQGNEYTSLKKEVYNAERKAEGKEVVLTNPNSMDEVENEVKRMFETGELSSQEVRDLSTALTNGTDINTKLTREQMIPALAHEKVTLEKEAREIDKKLQADPLDADLVMTKAQNEIFRYENYVAKGKLLSEASRMFNHAQKYIAEDYSFFRLQERVKEAIDNKEITTEAKEQLKLMASKIEELQSEQRSHRDKVEQADAKIKELEEAKLKIEEENSRLHAQNEIYNEQVKARERVYQSKKSDISQKKADLKERIIAKYKKIGGTANAGLNLKLLELAPEVAALGRLFVEEGVVEIDHLVKKIHDELKDAIR